MTSTEAVSPSRVERSPADVLRLLVALVVAVALLLIELLFGDTLVAFASELLSGLQAVPGWMVDVVVVGTRVLGFVVFVGGAAWAVTRRQWRMLTAAAIAVALAEVLVALQLLTNTPEGQASIDVGVTVGRFGRQGFPSVWGIGAVVAALTAAAPWLDRRWRRVGWVLIVGTVVTDFLDSPVSFDWLASALAGWVAGAAVLVALGAPSRRPTADTVMEGLARVGLPLRQLTVAGVDARGSTPYFGIADNGDELFVKALGDDERSADLMFRVYRRLRPRNFGDEKAFSTLRRAVEHEALVALAARDMPLRTPRLRAFAAVEPNGYVLAYDKIKGRSLDRLEPAQLTDSVLTSIWRLVGQLRARRIAHRDLRLANIFMDDEGEVWLIDFGFSEMAASDLLLANDVAELLASSSLYVGSERAVTCALANVDRKSLWRARDRLHPWALAGATRTALKERNGFLGELRSRLDAAIGASAKRS
ncbi:MAG TPA: phosphotransferase [Ilumatobacteraceae bacterium]